LLFEHFLYAAVLVVIVGMVYERYTDVNPAWIIFIAAAIPDSDYVVRVGLERAFSMRPALIQHGDFHNIVMLLVFTVFLGYIISRISRVKLEDAMVCVFLGVLLHFACDAYVYVKSYPFFAPFSSKSAEAGIFIAKENIMVGDIGIASTNIISLGLIFLAIAVLIRIRVQGWRWFIDLFPSTHRGKVTRLLTSVGIVPE
jgi:membrane-bound metal-dependent hydrolase YbcI (DUF457 family)